MKKFKISQGFVESASSDSSSSSLLGHIGHGGDESDSRLKTTQNSSLSFAIGKNATIPAGSLTLNIGSLSSLGQIVKRTPPGLQKSGISIHNIVGKSGLNRSNGIENYEVSIGCQPTMVASGALLHPGKNVIATVPKSSLPVALQALPVKSAFSVPRTCQQAALGLSSLMTYSLASGSNASALNSSGNPTSLLITSGSGTSANICDIGGSKQYEVGMTTTSSSNNSSMNQTSCLEPNQEQVQAIQKLQFHDFPLTTTCLTRTTSTGGPVITQAKILSSSGLDFRKLKTISAGKAASLLLTSSGKQAFVTSQDIPTNSKMFTSVAEQDCGFVEPINSKSLIQGDLTKKPNSPLNFTVSSVKLHLPEHQSQLRDSPGKVLTPKAPQLSVLMLSPEKLNQIDKLVNKPVLLTSEAASITQDLCNANLLLSLPSAVVDASTICSNAETESSSFVVDVKEANCSLSSEGNSQGVLGPPDETYCNVPSTVPSVDKVEPSLISGSTSTLPSTECDSSSLIFDRLHKDILSSTCPPSELSSPPPPPSVEPSSRSDDHVASASHEQPPVTIKSPSRSSRSKPPPFPTIAATRTRRIRAPKYMYYDL